MTTTSTRIATIDAASGATGTEVDALLERTRAASGNRLLNMHLQMAVAPAVLGGYMGLREALGAYSRIDGRTRGAVAVAASAADNGGYTLAINSMLARREGWTDEQIHAIREGRSCGDPAVDHLLDIVRTAISGDGSVEDHLWADAKAAGWSDVVLAELYAVIGLVAYCDRFVRYAGTAFDVAPSAGH